MAGKQLEITDCDGNVLAWMPLTPRLLRLGHPESCRAFDRQLRRLGKHADDWHQVYSILDGIGDSFM